MENMQTGPRPEVVIMRQKTSGWAIAGLILGVLSIILFFVGPILAVVFSLVALRKIRRSGGQLRGRGLAIAGAILGLVFFVSHLSCAKFSLQGRKEGDEVVSAFFEKMNSQDYQGAYALCSQECQRVTSYEDFARIARHLEDKLGRLQEKKSQGFRVFGGFGRLGRIHLTLNYALEYEKAEGWATFRLVKKGDQWKIFSFNINSPALLLPLETKEPSEE